MQDEGLLFEVSRIFRLDGEGKVRAFVDLTVGGKLILKGFRVVDGTNGLFVGFPQGKSNKDGKWYPTARPLTREFRDELAGLILEAYQT